MSAALECGESEEENAGSTRGIVECFYPITRVERLGYAGSNNGSEGNHGVAENS